VRFVTIAQFLPTACASARTFHPVEILTTVAFIYFAIAFPLTRAVTIVEQRLLRKIEA
jgi:polar amino acid transport system permease protein